jgi:hypothetical protein
MSKNRMPRRTLRIPENRMPRRTLRMPENRMKRITFGLLEEGIAGRYKKLHY